MGMIPGPFLLSIFSPYPCLLGIEDISVIIINKVLYDLRSASVSVIFQISAVFRFKARILLSMISIMILYGIPVKESGLRAFYNNIKPDFFKIIIDPANDVNPSRMISGLFFQKSDSSYVKHPVFKRIPSKCRTLSDVGASFSYNRIRVFPKIRKDSQPISSLLRLFCLHRGIHLQIHGFYLHSPCFFYAVIQKLNNLRLFISLPDENDLIASVSVCFVPVIFDIGKITYNLIKLFLRPG